MAAIPLLAFVSGPFNAAYPGYTISFSYHMRSAFRLYPDPGRRVVNGRFYYCQQLVRLSSISATRSRTLLRQTGTGARSDRVITRDVA
uniref:Putative secreted protein n=1 Tax=Anopheles darlingi TaxID=43151 RepID=A0A2M4DCM9_ANODA